MAGMAPSRADGGVGEGFAVGNFSTWHRGDGQGFHTFMHSCGKLRDADFSTVYPHVAAAIDSARHKSVTCGNAANMQVACYSCDDSYPQLHLRRCL